ncbi:hypothetical protein ACNNLS_07435, partial [Aerococcus viridans]
MDQACFFETKAALVAKHPNGAPGVALVRETDPAKIYVWNGSAWEDFGDYQGIEVKDGTITSNKVADGAISPGKTDFIKVSTNLLNPDNVEFGKRYTTEMATVFLTNFIRCRTSFRMLFRL